MKKFCTVCEMCTYVDVNALQTSLYISPVLDEIVLKERRKAVCVIIAIWYVDWLNTC